MFFTIAIVLVVLLFAISNLFFKMRKDKFSLKYEGLVDKKESILSIDSAVSESFKELEEKMDMAFVAYELARDISPLIEKDKLLNVFADRLKDFGGIDDIVFSSRPKNGYENYALDGTSPRYLGLSASSSKIKEYIPLFLYQLNLCLERISLYEKLQGLSIYDSLTQVYNRRYLTERANEELERAKKFAFSVSFLMIDIDFFKKVNDTYGHIVGDVVLRNVAFIIKDVVREIDTVGRYGGEEFVVVLPEVSKKGAVAAAKRIAKRIASAKIRAFDETIKITVSAGVSSYPESSSHLDMLIEVVDKALYRAKNSGRNNVSWF